MKTISALTLLCLAASNSGAHPAHEEAFSVAAVKRSQVTPAAESQSRVTISVEGDFRVIRANGVPNHKTGAFPNRNNPNVISAQNYEFRVPTNPQIASQPTALRMQPFG